MKPLPLLAFFLSVPAWASGFTPNVIYDDDDRIELHEVQNPASYFTAQATVAFFEKDALLDEGDGTTTVLGGTYGEDNDLCRDERFFSQPSAAFCSGVLIAPDLVLTAGHCVERDFCKNTRFALDYGLDSKDRNPRKLRTADLLECKNVGQRLSPSKKLDFALIRLKSVPRVNPLTLAKEDMKEGQELVLTGYPAGLPMKVVEGAKVARVGRLYGYAPIDAFGGNSGSPVVDLRTGHLLGILVGGEDDFEKAPRRDCKRVKRCSGSKCKGEEILKISAIVDAINK